MTLARRSAGERFCDVLRSTRRLDDEFRSRIENYLRAIAIEALANKAAGTLSYGERRLVSNLMALLTGAQIVLMDEPFSNVDVVKLEALKRLLRKEAQEARRCFLIIEHSPENLAYDLIDSVFCLRQTLVVNGFEGSAQETLRVFHSFTLTRLEEMPSMKLWACPLDTTAGLCGGDEPELKRRELSPALLGETAQESRPFFERLQAK